MSDFVSEPITPEPGSFDPRAMASGLGALPRAFTWRGRRYAIVECLGRAKVSVTESFSGERYLRRQEFDVRLDTGQRATIYLLRHAPRGASARAARRRWFLLSIDEPPGDR